MKHSGTRETVDKFHYRAGAKNLSKFKLCFVAVEWNIGDARDNNGPTSAKRARDEAYRQIEEKKNTIKKKRKNEEGRGKMERWSLRRG